MNAQLTQAMLQLAARMAAGGEYQAASALLEHSAPATEQPAAALLRAKIAAQQGDYRQAIAYWQEVLSMTPNHQEAQAGIALAQRLAERKASRFYLRANFYYAILLLIIAGLLGLLALTMFRSAGRSEQNEQTRQLQQAVESLKTIAADNRRDGQTSDAATPVELKFNLSGVTLRPEGREQVLSFAEGLFQGGGAKLKPEARDLLSALGRQLEPYVGQFSVCVIGHTDDVPAPAGSVYRDNDELAMARALAVVEHLRASARLPASMFTIRGLGEAAAPYPNDAPSGRARNRTVVMRIERIGK